MAVGSIYGWYYRYFFYEKYMLNGYMLNIPVGKNGGGGGWTHKTLEVKALELTAYDLK